MRCVICDIDELESGGSVKVKFDSLHSEFRCDNCSAEIKEALMDFEEDLEYGEIEEAEENILSYLE